MRKYFGGLVAVLAIAMLVPGTALATHSNGQGPDKDFRHGTHKGFCPTPFGSFPCQVHVSGQSESATGPGVPAQGNWFIRIFAGDFLGLGTVELSGEVVCLTAIGNSTWIKAEDRPVEHRSGAAGPNDPGSCDRQRRGVERPRGREHRVLVTAGYDVPDSCRSVPRRSSRATSRITTGSSTQTR